jgi:hypothetical protein
MTNYPVYKPGDPPGVYAISEEMVEQVAQHFRKAVVERADNGLNHMQVDEDGKWFCVCTSTRKIEPHDHSWAIAGLLVDRCRISGCHESRYA